MTSRYHTHTPEETRALAQELGSSLSRGDVVLIEGSLGAGKTVFAAGLAAGLGVQEPVTSPSYPIVAEYHGHVPVYHLDLYRIHDAREAQDTGLEEYIVETAVTIVEWPSRAPDLLPQHCIHVDILVVPGNARAITITTPE